MSARPNNSQEHACSIDIACVIGCSVKRYPAKLDFVTMMLDDRSGQEQVVDDALVRMLYFIVCSCESEQFQFLASASLHWYDNLPSKRLP